MSTQGQGDCGVYFSTLGPASYDLGSPEYEDNIISDCFGKERLEEYRGQRKLDVCLVYGVEPSVLQQAPGGRDNAKMVSKAAFTDLALPHADGNYYLRPDRILAAFLLDPANPPVGVQAVADGLDTEKQHDELVKDVLAAAEKELTKNELLAQSVYTAATATTKVEWACNFTANKFKTTFEAVVESSVSASQVLVFFYSSLTEVDQVLRSGFPAIARRGGVVFTLHSPHDLLEADTAAFPCREAFVACALPVRFLRSYTDAPGTPPVPRAPEPFRDDEDSVEAEMELVSSASKFVSTALGGVEGSSSLRLVSRQALEAMRGSFFGEVARGPGSPGACCCRRSASSERTSWTRSRHR
jgi:hypothetical protein